MNTHDLLLKVLEYALSAGLSILVPVVIKYILTLIGKEALLKNMTLAENVMKTIANDMKDADYETKIKAAEIKLSELTHSALTADEIDHLLGSAIYELGMDIQQAVNAAPAVPVVDAPAPITETPIAPVADAPKADAPVVDEPAK